MLIVEQAPGEGIPWVPLTPVCIEDCVELRVLLLRQLVGDHSPLAPQRLRARREELYERSFLINAWTKQVMGKGGFRS